MQFLPASCGTELFRQCGRVAGFDDKLLKRSGVGLILRPRLFDLLRAVCDLLYKGVNFSLDSGPFSLFPLGFRLSGHPGRKMFSSPFNNFVPRRVVSQDFSLLTNFCQFTGQAGNIGGRLIGFLLRQIFLLSACLHLGLKLGHTTAQACDVIDVLDHIA